MNLLLVALGTWLLSDGVGRGGTDNGKAVRGTHTW